MPLFCLNRHDEEIPHLPERIAAQRREGGRLVLYRRAWSLLAVTTTQDRIEHVPFHKSRIAAGVPHCLFTLLLGPWSFGGIFAVPMLLIMNLRGGIDVTGRFSTTSINPMRELSPESHQADRDFAAAQWTFVFLGLLVVIGTIVFVMDSPFPR